MDVVNLIFPNRNQLYFEIALVDEPAIESEVMMFNKTDYQFKEVEGEEGLMMGYLMIAEKEILRMDAKRGAYKVKFPKETIDMMIENFQLNNQAKNINFMHQTGQFVEGVFVRNHWQIDSKKGIVAPKGFKTEADGSWFVVLKCENNEVKEKFKANAINGLSLESKFVEEAIDKYFKTDISKVELTKTNTKTLYNKFKNMNIDLKEAFNAFVEYFSKEEAPAKTEKFEELVLVDGETKVMIDPEVAVGSAIALFDMEGNAIPAPIGSYELQDGRVITVEVEGVIATVVEAAVEGEELDAEVKPTEGAKENAAVKRLIERIEKVSEFEKQIAELKEENAKAKTESEYFHKENDELKIKFSDLEKFTKETLETIKGLVSSEEGKAPVQDVKKPFEFKKKTTIYPFLNK